jgi:hypothetical protein
MVLAKGPPSTAEQSMDGNNKKFSKKKNAPLVATRDSNTQ